MSCTFVPRTRDPIPGAAAPPATERQAQGDRGLPERAVSRGSVLTGEEDGCRSRH
jgi:hypothetical protein